MTKLLNNELGSEQELSKSLIFNRQLRNRLLKSPTNNKSLLSLAQIFGRTSIVSHLFFTNKGGLNEVYLIDLYLKTYSAICFLSTSASNNTKCENQFRRNIFCIEKNYSSSQLRVSQMFKKPPAVICESRSVFSRHPTKIGIRAF